MDALTELKDLLRELTGMPDQELSVIDDLCSIKRYKKKALFTGSYYDLHLQKPSLVTIEALADSTVVLIDHKKYQQLVQTDSFWLKVSYTIAHNLLMKKFERELQLLTLAAVERYELLQKRHPELEQLVPSYHLSAYLRSTPIFLSRRRAGKKN